MLLANKKDLQQKLRLSILTIEEKELAFYFQNMQRMGTISAFLALFILGAFFGRDPLQDDVNNNPVIVYSFLSVNMIAFLCECIVVLRTMELCIRGPGLGLRGPEGSMTRAVFIMRQESKVVYKIFYTGLFFYHVSAGLYLYVLSEMELTLPIPGLILVFLALCWLYVDYSRTSRILKLPAKHYESGWSGYDPIPFMPDPRRLRKTNRARAAIARALNPGLAARNSFNEGFKAEGSCQGRDAGVGRSSFRSGMGSDPKPPPAQPASMRSVLERMASKLAGGGELGEESNDSPAKRRLSSTLNRDAVLNRGAGSSDDAWLVGKRGASRPDVMSEMGNSLGIPSGCNRSGR